MFKIDVRNIELHLNFKIEEENRIYLTSYKVATLLNNYLYLAH